MKQIALAILCSVFVAFALRPGAVTAPADVIHAWSGLAGQLAVPPAMHPLRAPITLAILHLAMYDAVNAIVRAREPYAARPIVPQPASPDAAAVEAGYRVLLHEFPGQAAALDATRQTLLASIPDGSEELNGIAVGAAVAARLLALREHDGRNAHPAYEPKQNPAPGDYQLTPPYKAVDSKFLALVTPFTMTSPAQFRPAGPPALDSKRYADDYSEVKRYGAASGSARTAAQTETARFWQPLAGTVWPVTIRRLADEQDLTLADKAHLEAAAFAAFADALIACWDAKFHFEFWRPVTAIRALTDGHAATQPDPRWAPLFETPNFPEYPSGHACATAAVAHTIEDYFEHDVPIPAHSITTNTDRTYRKAAEVVDEVVEARMLIGAHFRTANEDGADIGRKIARQIRSRWFKLLES